MACCRDGEMVEGSEAELAQRRANFMKLKSGSIFTYRKKDKDGKVTSPVMFAYRKVADDVSAFELTADKRHSLVVACVNRGPWQVPIGLSGAPYRYLNLPFLRVLVE